MVGSDQERHLALYSRVSTEIQVDRDALANQKEALIRYAKRQGKPFRYYCDAGFSAKDTKRPDFQQMMAEVGEGNIDAIVVTKLDRISRSLGDLLSIIDRLEEAKVAFVCLTQNFDTATPVGRFSLHLLGSVGQLEREMTAERVAEAMRIRAQRKLWNGGPVPFGFEHDRQEKTLRVNSKESSVVRMIYDYYVETASLRGTVHHLNSEGYRTRSGKFWPTQTVRRILTNPLYYGAMAYNRRKSKGSTSEPRPAEQHILIEGVFPSMISKDQFDRVQQIIIAQQGKTPATKGSIYLLSGLVRCGKCGEKMYGYTIRPSGGRPKYQYYRCNGHISKGTACCSGNSIELGVLEEIILAELESFKTDPDKIAKRALTVSSPVPDGQDRRTPGTPELQNQLSRSRKKRDRLIDLFQEGMITKGEFSQRALNLDQEQTGLEQRLVSLRREPEDDPQPDFQQVSKALGSLSDVLRSLDTGQQKELLRTVIGDITVDASHVKYSVYALPTPFLVCDCTGRRSDVQTFRRSDVQTLSKSWISRSVPASTEPDRQRVARR